EIGVLSQILPYDIELEKFIKKVQIEARVMGDLALNHIIPVAVKYQNELLNNINGLKQIGLPAKNYAVQLKIVEEISNHLQQVYNNADALVEARKVANKIEDTRTKAIAYDTDVKAKYFEILRYHVDKLEHLVCNNEWTLPKYRELLFVK
ncbi:MAG TPA: glutamine synthetase type III, partial [Chitinophagaceae bacterium]|nr:glutamine synthetase type III [Chitinophagaceae bacterium]